VRQYGVAAVTNLDNGDELLFVYGTLMNPAERVILLGRPIDASPGGFRAMRAVESATTSSQSRRAPSQMAQSSKA